MTSGDTDLHRSRFYEHFADEFDARMNRYEVDKRLDLIFNQALASTSLRDVSLLDAGCGTGLFSQAAAERGAMVTSLDVGERLLAAVAQKCDTNRVIGDLMALPFDDSAFDVAICTEVIEHVPNPRKAVGELARVLREDGVLVLTTPNRAWHWSITIANWLRIRPYEGLENWVRWSEIPRWLREDGLRLDWQAGFNALPFIHPRLYRINDRLDRFGCGWYGRLMINMAVVAHKKEPAPLAPGPTRG